MAKKKKKSWKKKLLKAALIGGALYGGSKLLGKMRGKGTGAVSTAGQAFGVDRITPPSKYLQKKVVPDIVPDAQDVGTTGIDYSKGNWKGFGHPIIQGNIQKKNEYIKRNTIPGYGTAVAPPGVLNPYRRPRGGGHPIMQGRTTNFKKGGRVTGIAKRGFGRALMKGKK